MINEMKSRRQVARWQAHRQARVKLEGSGSFVDAQLSDISLKGLKITLSEKLPIDQHFKLDLVLSDEFNLCVEVWVAWQKTFDNLNTYGLYFSKIKDSDKERVYQFIRKDFPAQINRQWWDSPAAQKGDEDMQDKNFEDRRIFERFKANLPLRFLNVRENKENTAKLFDFSARGLGIVSSQRLQPYAPLEIWVDVPDNGQPLYARGEVAWSAPVDGDGFRSGVKLENTNLMALSRILRVTQS